MINDFETAYALVGWAVKAKHDRIVSIYNAMWEEKDPEFHGKKVINP